MHESAFPKKSPIILFITILSLFLYIANLVVYEALASIFSITTSSYLIILGTLLGVLTGSLIVSTIVGMRYYSKLTRFYSIVSSVWIGLFIYLFFASVVYGLVIMTPIRVPSYFGYIVLLCAVLASLYGIVHAKHIYIVEEKVFLRALPQSWQHKKIVWVSDLHLGQIHGRAFAKKVKETINAISPDIIFIGGDLFDGTGAPDLPILIEPLKELKATHGTYFVTGNHEEFGSSEKFIAAVKSIGIRVIQDEVVEVDGIQIVGVDYATTSRREKFKNILSRIFVANGGVSILLKHEPKNSDIARDAGISLQISGHTHRAQQWPLEYIARMVYGKFTYGLQKTGDTQVFTSSGVGTWGPPIRVGTNSEIVVLELINPEYDKIVGK